jgi:gamma-glutamylcyclotransferase (GGCT)/AIG2-like uncharacterized protein YtfP
MLLAVYGNMRRKGFNHSLLEGEKYIGLGIVPGLSLYVDGRLPVARYRDGGRSITVEVYDVPLEKLRLLDILEGAVEDENSPATFHREVVSIQLIREADDTGAEMELPTPRYLAVHLYIYNFRPSDRSRVGHGDYIRYLREIGILPFDPDEEEERDREVF